MLRLSIHQPLPAQIDFVDRYVNAIPSHVWLAVAILFIGVAVGLLVARLNRRILIQFGVPEYIEGTAFERAARNLGTSTVTILSQLTFYFIIGVAFFAALSAGRVNYASTFWNSAIGFLPQLFVAVLIVIIGIVIGDKMELLIVERLRAVKLPQTGIIPTLVKYTVFYVAALVALSQLGVATLALVVLLAAYAFALVIFAAAAGYDLLASGAAGAFLLLNQPYVIGDEIRIEDTQGVVQEVGLFVTHVETDGEEYIIPNRHVLTTGVVRVRS